jgi:hypothetical protein
MAYPALHLNDVLISQGVGRVVHFGAGGGVKNNLGKAPAIAQINKDQAAVVPSPVDPARKGDVLSFVFGAKLAAGMCSIHNVSSLG